MLKSCTTGNVCFCNV